MNVRTVHELLRFPLIQVNRMRGVGSRTRKELTDLARRLAERFPETAKAPKTIPAEDTDEISDEAARASVDELRRQTASDRPNGADQARHRSARGVAGIER